ncbi:MAG: 30S ribosomal protein S6 [Candidatus Sumerlaeaceae bacterium]|nr:30S ribosomal protein S6 [Candidatus Sumerlaeaceae bacterium]
MAKYELVVIYDPYLPDTDYDQQIEKVKEQIVRRGGTVTNVDVWGKRQMAYEIRKKPEGYYVIFTFEGTMTSGNLRELERSLRLNEAVLREMCVAIPAPKPPKPEKKKKARPATAEAAPAVERRVFTETRSAGDAGAALTTDADR